MDIILLYSVLYLAPGFTCRQLGQWCIVEMVHFRLTTDSLPCPKKISNYLMFSAIDTTYKNHLFKKKKNETKQKKNKKKTKKQTINIANLRHILG